MITKCAVDVEGVDMSKNGNSADKQRYLCKKCGYINKFLNFITKNRAAPVIVKTYNKISINRAEIIIEHETK